MDSTNPANTSILPLKNSEFFLALYEGGLPFMMKKANLESVGFENFGWINSAFSAHPKVDPENGDIFNIGTDFSKETLQLLHSTKEMKKIKEGSLKLRSLQSIHDFCLAGDYIVILECPMIFSFLRLIFQSTFKSIKYDESYPTLCTFSERVIFLS